MTFLLRFWKPAAALILLLSLAAALASFGHDRYTAGQAAERAIWQARFEQAQRAIAAANARTAALESAQIAISDDYARRFSESNKILAERSAAADKRIRGLVRKLAAHTRRCELSPDAIPTVPIDEPAEVGERIERAGERIVRIGAACESDAITLTLLQQWVRAQSELVE